MESQEKFEPAGQDVVAEEIDGEVIIVNLKNGNYYSLMHSASVTWGRIQQGATLKQLRDHLVSRYSGDTEVMEEELAGLVKALEDEELVVRCADTGPGPAPAETDSVTPEGGEKPVFQAPVFERFTDMEDLLLLDPVHEAEDEKGWPHAKEEVE